VAVLLIPVITDTARECRRDRREARRFRRDRIAQLTRESRRDNRGTLAAPLTVAPR